MNELFEESVSDNWYKTTTNFTSLDFNFLHKLSKVNDFAHKYFIPSGNFVNLGIGFTEWKPIADLDLTPCDNIATESV